MAKYLRLSRHMRDQLSNLVREKIDSPETYKAQEVIRRKAHQRVLEAIGRQFPPDEMEILKKHNCAQQHQWVDMIVVQPDGTSHYANWGFPAKTPEEVKACPLLPSTPYGRMKLRIEGDDAVLMKSLYAAESAHNAVVARKREPFFELIKAARYLEQVEEAWPEASRIRPFLETQLPAVQISPLQDAVKAILDRMNEDAQKKEHANDTFGTVVAAVLGFDTKKADRE